MTDDDTVQLADLDIETLARLRRALDFEAVMLRMELGWELSSAKTTDEFELAAYSMRMSYRLFERLDGRIETLLEEKHRIAAQQVGADGQPLPTEDVTA